MFFIKKVRQLSIHKNFDYMLLALVLALSLIGILAVSSATLTWPDHGTRIMTSQLIGLGIGIIAALMISTMDYRYVKFLGVCLYILSIILLILVLVIGTGDHLGSKSWIRLGPVSFQPAEIAKIGFIIVLAIFLGQDFTKTKHKLQNLIKVTVYTILPIGLVLLQKDFGTTMVFIFILLSMLFVWGIKYRYILSLLASLVMSSPIMWFFVLNEKRKDRIRAFFNPSLDPNGASFNVIRAKMTIGSGQLLGKGLYKGVQTQNSAVPVKESDFIFSVIGEELGFIGATATITLMFLLIMRCIYIAKTTKDKIGTLLVTGVCSMLTIHFIENVGMTIGLLPVTGIPLPFISAGGSSMITNYIAIGIVLSVHNKRRTKLFHK